MYVIIERSNVISIEFTVLDRNVPRITIKKMIQHIILWNIERQIRGIQLYRTIFNNGVIEASIIENPNNQPKNVKICLNSLQFGLLNHNIYVPDDGILKDLENDFEDICCMNYIKNIPDDKNICSICMEEFKQNDKMTFLNCTHNYHKKCIEEWFCKKSVYCPMCRCDIREEIKECKDKLGNLTVKKLKNLARSNEIRGYSKLKKQELIEFIKLHI
jgi:hypothetical protein